jgi:hypothetical protein
MKYQGRPHHRAPDGKGEAELLHDNITNYR